MKKFLLSLFVWLFGFISFWYCDTVEDLINIIAEWNTTASYNSWYSITNLTNPWTYCIYFDPTNDDYITYLRFWIESNTPQVYLWVSPNTWWCMTTPNYNQKFFVQANSPSVNFDYKIIEVNELLSTALPRMTSSECQLEYSLIPVSSVDTNYCVWNGLCPNECWSWSGYSWDLQYSNIYINSILHPWEENIFINIPDYIQWDYFVSSWEFNIYVWSWYDMDYMNSIIKINSYRPDSTDFTDIFVSGLTLIFPYIFVLLLIVFIWKLIKRIFK